MSDGVQPGSAYFALLEPAVLLLPNPSKLSLRRRDFLMTTLPFPRMFPAIGLLFSLHIFLSKRTLALLKSSPGLNVQVELAAALAAGEKVTRA